MHIVNLRTDLNATAAANDSEGYAVLGFFIEVSLCLKVIALKPLHSCIVVDLTTCIYNIVALHILRQPMRVANQRAGRTSPHS